MTLGLCALVAPWVHHRLEAQCWVVASHPARYMGTKCRQSHDSHPCEDFAPPAWFGAHLFEEARDECCEDKAGDAQGTQTIV